MEISFYNNWLNDGQPFAEGVAFYKKFGNSNTLKKLFATGESAFAKEKLCAELAKIKVKTPISAKTQTTDDAPVVSYKKQKIDRAALPPHLQKEFDKLHELIGTMAHKHAQLEMVPTNADRYVLAKEINEAADKRQNIFNRIDHWLEKGTDLVPTAEKKKVQEAKKLRELELLNELRLLRSQRSRLKKNPKRVKDYNDVCEEIDVKTKELNDVRTV